VADLRDGGGGAAVAAKNENSVDFASYDENRRVFRAQINTDDRLWSQSISLDLSFVRSREIRRSGRVGVRLSHDEHLD
jgi:hypothetical protein